ncbi:hypothetical protein [Streptomyces sp. NPDC051704]|uniref:hypothetical protein n=1 Tax=Streptomyces sp. NPDC051704 TaxID=3365671 RepID=UPI00379B3745
MAKRQPKLSQPTHGEAPSPHKGTEQHGWSPDVDETRQQDNPSAHRSFHPEKYAPATGPGRIVVSEEESGNLHCNPSRSMGRRGEDQSKGSSDRGMHDTGRRGRSQDPPGTRSAG